nr:retrovirus-related Pol polyprotein from transposon TNT 1-94 [Tanacetum cinerariifolium]
MALGDDELTIGKSHARNGEWVDITIRKCRDELLSLKQDKLDVVTFQIQNIELTKLYHDLQEHLNEEKRINEKWLTSSKKVSQCISEQIPHQKKKVIGGELLTESLSKININENALIPASMGYDQEMVLKTKDRVERLNLNSILLKFNTRRILVLKSQAVNESLKTLNTPESSKDSEAEFLTLLPPLKNLQGASPSSKIMPLTFQPHSLKERPGLGIMKHTKPETQDSSNKSVLGTVTISKTKQIKPLTLTEVNDTEQESKLNELTKLVQMLLDEKRHIREPIWYLNSGCPRSMTGVKSYMHKYVEKLGPKVVFSDNSSCITKGYGSINCGENHVPEVIVPNEHGVPLTENIEDPPDLINTKETYEQNVQDDQLITQPIDVPSGNNTKVSRPITEPLVSDVTQSHIPNQAFTSSHPAPQDRWSRDQHIKHVNIIGNRGKGMLTRSMASKLTSLSASKCLFADFLSEIEPKKVFEVLCGNYSSIEQVNSIWQLLAYSLITGTEVDTGEIIYSDLVTKLLNKSRPKYVSYPRFISCALQVLLGLDYTQDKKFGFLPPILKKDIKLASTGFPTTLDEGTRKSKPLPEGMAKTTPRPERSHREKDSGRNKPLADMELLNTTYADLLGTDANKEDILGAGDEMDDNPQSDETQHHSSPPQGDKPTSSIAPHPEASDTDSSSDNILKKYDETLPLTERQLVNYLRKVSRMLFERITEDQWEKHEEAAVYYANLKAFIDDSNVEGKNATHTTIEEPPSYTKGAQPIKIIHPEPSVLQKEGKGIGTDDQAEDQRKLVKASSIVHPDPDKPEKIKKAKEEASLNAISKTEVIKVIHEEAKKIGIHPKEAISSKAGELFKRVQDAEHEVFKRQHTKKVRKTLELRKHKGTDGRIFDVHKLFLFGAFGISELDELREIIPKKKNTMVNQLLGSAASKPQHGECPLLGQMIYLVASLTFDSVRSPEGFVFPILLLVVIIVTVVIVVVILVFVVVAIVGVVIVVKSIGVIIGVVVVVTIIGESSTVSIKIISFYNQVVKFIFHFLYFSSRTILIGQDPFQFSPGDLVSLLYSNRFGIGIPPGQGILGESILNIRSRMVGGRHRAVNDPAVVILMNSLSRRYEMLRQILGELGIQFALLAPEEAPSQTPGRKQKHMELEPETRIPRLEFNQTLPENVPWSDIDKVGMEALVSYLVAVSMVKSLENERFSMKVRKLIAVHHDQEKLKSTKVKLKALGYKMD